MCDETFTWMKMWCKYSKLDSFAKMDNSPSSLTNIGMWLATSIVKRLHGVLFNILIESSWVAVQPTAGKPSYIFWGVLFTGNCFLERRKNGKRRSSGRRLADSHANEKGFATKVLEMSWVKANPHPGQINFVFFFSSWRKRFWHKNRPKHSLLPDRNGFAVSEPMGEATRLDRRDHILAGKEWAAALCLIFAQGSHRLFLLSQTSFSMWSGSCLLLFPATTGNFHLFLQQLNNYFWQMGLRCILSTTTIDHVITSHRQYLRSYSPKCESLQKAKRGLHNWCNAQVETLRVSLLYLMGTGNRRRRRILFPVAHLHFWKKATWPRGFFFSSIQVECEIGSFCWSSELNKYSGTLAFFRKW